MSVFAVPKDKQAIIVHFDNGDKIGGDIFLERAHGVQSIRNRMTAFLESETGNSYFPFRPENGTTEFVNKKHIIAIEFAYEGQDDSLCVSMNISAVLMNGGSVSGTLIAEVPSELSRLSDCLNQRNNFLAVKTGASMLFLNKNMIKKVMLAA